jgi:hypothetical protein
MEGKNTPMSSTRELLSFKFNMSYPSLIYHKSKKSDNDKSGNDYSNSEELLINDIIKKYPNDYIKELNAINIKCIFINDNNDTINDILINLIKTNISNPVCKDNSLLKINSLFAQILQAINEPLYYIKYTDKIYTAAELTNIPDVNSTIFDFIDFNINSELIKIHNVDIHIPNYKFDKLLIMMTFHERYQVNDKDKNRFNESLLHTVKNIILSNYSQSKIGSQSLSVQTPLSPVSQQTLLSVQTPLSPVSQQVLLSPVSQHVYVSFQNIRNEFTYEFNPYNTLNTKLSTKVIAKKY